MRKEDKSSKTDENTQENKYLLDEYKRIKAMMPQQIIVKQWELHFVALR